MATGEGDYGRLWPVARVLVPPVMRLLWKVRAEGLDNLPDGPAILCPNHTSVLDSFLMPVAVLPAAGKRRVLFIGKSEYLDSWKTRHLFPALGMIPVDRSGGEAAQRALDTAADALERGHLFGIYPEGTRSRDGRLHKGHTGPARLALRTGAPLVPIGIVGSLAIMPPEAKLPRVFKACSVRVGRPISPEHWAHRRTDDRLVLRQITDELMYEIRELSGQEYIDEYATRKREAEAEVPMARSSADVLSGNGAVTRSGATQVAR